MSPSSPESLSADGVDDFTALTFLYFYQEIIGKHRALLASTVGPDLKLRQVKYGRASSSEPRHKHSATLFFGLYT